MPLALTTSIERMVPAFLSRCGVWIRIGRSNFMASSICCSKYFCSAGVWSSKPISPTAKDRQKLYHPRRDVGVVRLLRVERHCAEVVDPELTCSEPLPDDQREEIVLEGANVAPGLTDPEGGLDHRHDAGIGHGAVVVGRARRHVYVMVKHLHRAALLTSPYSMTRSMSAGTDRPAARRSLA